MKSKVSWVEVGKSLVIFAVAAVLVFVAVLGAIKFCDRHVSAATGKGDITYVIDRK